MDRSTVYRWARAGVVRSRRLGRKWQVRLEDVQPLADDESLRPPKTGRPPGDKPPARCRTRGCDNPQNRRGGAGGFCPTCYQRRRRARLRKHKRK